MNKMLIIFGCGRVGYEALTFLGSENIECFCDNNRKMVGKEIFGKIVISFEELKQKHSDAVIMICADYRHSCEISKQCEENGIFDYLYYFFFGREFNECSEALAYLDNPMRRMEHRKYIYLRQINELTRQVKYLEGHIDIRDLKPARGKLRAFQLNVVKAAAELLEKIKELEIKPILDSGNLLGYVRHNGFIPWDDDIDFELIRDEYEKLKQYCRLRLFTQEEFYNKVDADTTGKHIASGMEDYYWKDGAVFIKIVKCDPYGREIEIDFFPLEYYSNEYSFDELKDFMGRAKERLAVKDSIEDIIGCLETLRAENAGNIAEESNNIYFGIDNLIMMNRYKSGNWIPKDVVYPLKKIMFEGKYFWIPNNPEKFLAYEYDNIWEFPEDIGMQRHLSISEEDE